MWTHEQHSSKEEVKVDIARLDIGVKFACDACMVFVGMMVVVGNQLIMTDG